MSSSSGRFTRRLITVACVAFLAVCTDASAAAQNWAATATRAYPVQYLQNAVAIGSLDPSTAVHIVVGLQEQNAGQVQSTLRRMLTPGDPLYGTTYTVQQFVAQFGPTTAQVQAVESYLIGGWDQPLHQCGLHLRLRNRG
jgi:subtilase family serine protease